MLLLRHPIKRKHSELLQTGYFHFTVPDRTTAVGQA